MAPVIEEISFRIKIKPIKGIIKTINSNHNQHYTYLAVLLNLNSFEHLASKLTLLYRASEYNFESSKFHKHCDGKAPTLVLIRSKSQNLFGGYSTAAWISSDGSCSKAPGSFLFSLDKQTKHVIFKNEDKAIENYSSFGPRFGSGSDISLNDKCNANTTSYSNLGNTYSLSNGLVSGSEEAKCYLAGSYKFEVAEYEVFGFK